MAKDIYKDFDDKEDKGDKPKAKAKTVKVKLLKGYVPADFEPAYGRAKAEPGEEIELPAEEAKALIDDGAAVAA